MEREYFRLYLELDRVTLDSVMNGKTLPAMVDYLLIWSKAGL